MPTNTEKEHYLMYHDKPSKFLFYLCCMKNFSHDMTVKSRKLRDLSVNSCFSHKNPLFNFNS